jgi:hypothetical protein
MLLQETPNPDMFCGVPVDFLLTDDGFLSEDGALTTDILDEVSRRYQFPRSGCLLPLSSLTLASRGVVRSPRTVMTR